MVAPVFAPFNHNHGEEMQVESVNTNRLSISAKVIADSVYNNSRLTTFEATFPRFVLAEFNTHRMISRNSASSRAIPVWKRLVDLLECPFVPMDFGKNNAGMQSKSSVHSGDFDAATKNWLVGRDVAVLQAFILAGGREQILRDSNNNPRAAAVCDKVEELSYHYRDVMAKMKSLSVGIHKQHANRVLEPYAWHTVIMTGTHWRNFYALRGSKMAQPEIRALAIAMATAHSESTPRELEQREWHLPYIFEDDKKEIDKPMLLARISSARCARVSYLTHDGKRSLDKDLEKADELQVDGHTSPFEHPARPRDITGSYLGNFGGNFGSEWQQYRKLLQNEHDFSKLIPESSLYEGMKEDQRLVDFVLSLKD